MIWRYNELFTSYKSTTKSQEKFKIIVSITEKYAIMLNRVFHRIAWQEGIVQLKKIYKPKRIICTVSLPN